MTEKEFNEMMERNLKDIMNFSPDEYDGVILWIPDAEEFLAMSFGNGSNSATLEDGCEDYIYFNQYEIDADTIGDDFMQLSNSDGGQMDIENIDIYDGNIIKAIPDILEFIYEKRYMDVIVIRFYVW